MYLMEGRLHVPKIPHPGEDRLCNSLEGIKVAEELVLESCGRPHLSPVCYSIVLTTVFQSAGRGPVIPRGSWQVRLGDVLGLIHTISKFELCNYGAFFLFTV